MLLLLPWVLRTGPLLAFHKKKDPVTLSLLPVGGGGACVCAGKPAAFGSQKGKLLYTPTNQTGEKGVSGSVAFGNNCAPAPRTVMLEQRNPTCDLRTCKTARDSLCFLQLCLFAMNKAA